MRPWLALVGLLLIVAAILVLGHSFTTMRYFCSECASERREVHVITFGLWTIANLGGRESPTEFTALVTAVDRRPCAHRWVFAVGSGGSYV